MIINSGNLRTLYTGFKAAYQSGLGQAVSQWDRVATRVPSSTKAEEYGWLGKIPNVREWIGDRVVQNVALHDYTIKNRKWELTVSVDADDIRDDTLGVYAPLFTEMGLSTVAHYDRLVYGLLRDGFTTPCYDGQPFFDLDHPVLDAAGNTVSVANTDGGAGTPWFLVDNTRALKPILLQVRKEWDFVSRDDDRDDNVFDRDEYVYGSSARCNAGYGFWQFAWGSRQDLDATHYRTARAAMQGMTGDYGRPLGVQPRLLVTGPGNEHAALELLNAERNAAGATNVYRGTAELLIVPWLV